jgi:hypothetical protein
VLVAASPALAQTSPEKAASAQALFDEGLRLVAAGQSEAACPKFAASQKLDPGMGTKFRLAECYEKIGKTASAWALFLEIGDEARAAKRPEREEIARKRAAALTPSLARMTIVVSPASANLPGLEVQREGIALDRAVWGVALPVDPGEHFLTATAPGRVTWESKPVVAQYSKTIEVTIPALDAQQKESALKPGSVETVPSEKRSLVPALILGSVGVVALGVGGALLGVGAGKKGDASTLHDQILGDKNGCVPGSGNLDSRCGDLKSQLNSAYSLQNIGVASVAVGGAAAIAAVMYLVWPAPRGQREQTRSLKIAPVTGREHNGLMVSGTF